MTELEIELQRCADLGEWPIVIGDMNAKLQMSNGELEHLSPNGKLLKEVVKKYKLSVVNFSEKCSGKWTHVIRTTEEKSVLDYIITNFKKQHLYLARYAKQLIEVRCPLRCITLKIRELAF